MIIAFFSGLLMALATPPLSFFPLAYIALAPLWIVIFNYVQNQGKICSFKLIIIPLFWGIGYHGLALFWITGIHPLTWMGIPWLSSLFITMVVWSFITLWGATLVVFWGVILAGLYRWLFHHKNFERNSFLVNIIVVIFASGLWCLLETLWTNSPLWWTTLSYTQSPHNLITSHLAQISGANTINAQIIAVNGLIASCIKFNIFKDEVGAISPRLWERGTPYIITTISLLIISNIIGLYLYIQPINNQEEKAIKIGLIQGNIPQQIKLYPEGWLQAIEGYTQGYQLLANQEVDLIITPETALPFLIDNLKQGSFYHTLLEKKITTIVGAFGTVNNDLNKFTNTLFTINGNGNIISQYSKVKLVPLGEYIPFQEILGNFISKLSPLDAILVPGNPEQILTTPFGNAIIGICYESVFGEIFRRQNLAGGEFIITASNNAYYRPEMFAQHHALDVIRAIENNRWTAIATNTGTSAIVNPHGQTIWKADNNKYQIHADTIYRLQEQTLYIKWGDWLTPLLLIIAGLGLGWIYIKSPD
jgi:apolipoprotein N-acyltransferase